MKEKYFEKDSPFSLLLWMYALALQELKKKPNFSKLLGLLCEVTRLLQSDSFTESASGEEKEDLAAIEREIFDVPAKAASPDLQFVRQALTNLGIEQIKSDLKLWTTDFDDDLHMTRQDFESFLREFAQVSDRKLPIEDFPRSSTVGGFLACIKELYPLPTPEKF